MANIDELIQFAQQDNRVCPKADYWNGLWEKLPDKKRVGAGWNPPLPLILAGAYCTSDDEKRDRLVVHLRYAEQKGVLDSIELYLKGLNGDQWVYGE